MSSRHNGPQKYAGARGKRHALPVVEREGEPGEGAPKKLSNHEIVQLLENDGVTRIQKLMRSHDELAVETLAEVAGDKKSSPSSRVTASTRILEYAHGKPLPILNRVAAGGGGGGITINVVKFYGAGEATKEEVIIEAEAVIEENT